MSGRSRSRTFKFCKSCSQTKLVSEFYVHMKMKDGHINYCKACYRERVRVMSLIKKRTRKPLAMFEEIKRVWQPGMTAKQIFEATDRKIVTVTLPTLITYFTKWKDELAPCVLPEKIIKVEEEEKPLYKNTYVNRHGITLPKIFHDEG